jgi:hypothetical protein
MNATMPELIGLREVSERTNCPLDTLRRGAAEAAARGLLKMVGNVWVCESANAATVAEVARAARRAGGK